MILYNFLCDNTINIKYYSTYKAINKPVSSLKSDIIYFSRCKIINKSVEF